MSPFTAMLETLAHAVQTLADGGGPFWTPNTTGETRPEKLPRTAAENVDPAAPVFQPNSK